jgi:exopolyphosphatase / guanosine-5'-triphosphate,3'-diphosphate pyrophosphatase
MPMLKALDSFVRDSLDRSRKIAIIDAGSNSFRLIVMTYIPGYRFQLTDEVREPVRLVHGMGKTNEMLLEQMDRAVDAMALYASFCRGLKIPDIRALATSAIREAANQDELLARVQQETGIEVRVLGEREEGYYGTLAVLNSTTLSDGHVLDLGGGSLQITRVDDREIKESVSFTLGAVRTTEEWLPDAPAKPNDVNRLRKHVRDKLSELDWFNSKVGGSKNKNRFVGQGGTLRNLARIVQKMHNYPIDELHGFILKRDDIRKVIRLLEPMTVEQRRAVPGMKPDRADITLAGALVIDEIMRHGGYDRMTVCSQGLREGIFYEHFLTDQKTPLFSDVRKASVLNVARLYNFQEEHAEHVVHLATSLFDQIQDDEFCGEAERELLWAACMLHDIGMAIDYNDHHRHSYYLILNSGLPGYTHRELALVALAAKYHRKGMPEVGELDKILDKDDEKRLLKITACLRLAEQLDRSRDGSVQQIRLRTYADSARLEALSDDDISVALWSAQNHAEFFRTAFGKRLEVEYVPGNGS